MTFRILIATPDPLTAPDSLEQIARSGIDPEFVISRDKLGNVISRFKHNKWDWRIYGASNTYNFESWWDINTRGAMDTLALQIVEEMKTLVWLCMFESTANAGRSRGISRLNQVLCILRALAKIAHALNTTLGGAESNAQFQVALRSSIVNADKGFSYQFVTIKGLLIDAAFWHTTKNIKCEVPRIVPEADLSDMLSVLLKNSLLAEDKREQHPLIPTRLFARVISGAQQRLKAIEPFFPSIEAYIVALQTDPTYCVDHYIDYQINTRRIRLHRSNNKFLAWKEAMNQCLSTAETIKRFGLDTYVERKALEQLRTLDTHITELQTLCVILIHAFSGMRSSEVKVMPFEPIAHSSAKGFGDLPVLVSHLKKFTDKGNYSSPLIWATSKEGVYAVRIAQQLARLKWIRRNTTSNSFPSDAPLFIGECCDKTSVKPHYQIPIANTIFSSRHWRNASESLGLTIEAEDLDELRVFDAFRAWDDNPEFEAGNYWPLTSHQFRRSVAVYASRSGMVSLPTLKTQFKHLSEVMTALYSENSTYAQNFLIGENGKPIDGGSILQSFRDAAAFNMSVRFHEQVIQSENLLSGPIGTQIQRAKEKNTLPKIFTSKDETQKAVKQGRFSYRETPVGGCVKKGSCTHFAIDLVLPCTSGCEHAILKPDKLDTYIESLRFDMKTLSPNSRPYQLIVKEIDFINSTYFKSAEAEK
ncbi:hypothetical protein [Cellvibrio sp. QJXJ]|uniref:hypothetical protein n=1 Tax=Cellvibrio sp. QJXJ TaxID=2964606 RepID=UPI0021C29F14|nr:hypothetical protein [Cellvibrio sp. QJXJ]UUA72096.1 hypothetical protein NNX04_16950 [Cellvibrio sp. QJXJ]